MGTDPTRKLRADESSITREQINAPVDALLGNIVPRNVQGDATDDDLNLGARNYRFRDIYLTEPLPREEEDQIDYFVRDGARSRGDPLLALFLKPNGAAGVRVIASPEQPLIVNFGDVTLEITENTDVSLVELADPKISFVARGQRSDTTDGTAPTISVSGVATSETIEVNDTEVTLEGLWNGGISDLNVTAPSTNITAETFVTANGDLGPLFSILTRWRLYRIGTTDNFFSAELAVERRHIERR